MTTSAGNSVELSMADDGKAAWVDFFLQQIDD